MEIVNHVFNLMHNSESLPVRVESASCIAEIVKDQAEFRQVIKPGLEQILTTFLQIMDLIECQDLIEAL